MCCQSFMYIEWKNPLHHCENLVSLAPIGTSSETSYTLQVLLKGVKSFQASILGILLVYQGENLGCVKVVKTMVKHLNGT